MHRRLHPLIWLTAATLTLFFTVCGWRNAHLERDINGVWLEGMSYGLAQISPNAKVQMYGTRSDQLDAVTAMMKERFPQQKATDWDEGTSPNMTMVQVLDPRVQSRFRATAYCVYDNKKTHGAKLLTLVRSPIKFWDSSWQVAKAEDARPRFNYFHVVS